MGTNGYRAVYAVLLRLYPRPFRKRFGEGMAQTFNDLCRERSAAKHGLLGFVLWIFCETLVGVLMENTIRMAQLGKTLLRVALVSLGLLMVPAVASRLVEGWNWPAAAFVRVYFLFFATGLVYALVARRMRARSYKMAVGLALVTAFALGWSTMVQTADSGHPERLWFLSVLAVGIVGAGLSRLRARALAWTLFAMAATLALIALLLPSGAPPDFAWRIAIGHGVYVALFIASGLLFRHASLAGPSKTRAD